jgi:hypothetical protein
MNKLVKKSNRRNLKSTKKSNRKLNKKSNRKNLRNSKLNKKSNRKNLNKKGGSGDPDLGSKEGYDCLCIKKNVDDKGDTIMYTNSPLQDANPVPTTGQAGGSRKSLRKNKSNKKSNLKKNLNRKGGDMGKKQLQFCKCEAHRDSIIDSKKKSITKCNCDPIATKDKFNIKEPEIKKFMDAFEEIATSAQAPAGQAPVSTTPRSAPGATSSAAGTGAPSGQAPAGQAPVSTS